MQINLTFDPSTELDEAQAIINALRGEGEEAAAPAPAKRAPAKKTAAKKTAAAPAEDPEPVDADAPTLEDAVARAQELVGKKLTQAVKDAVTELGAERVTKLKPSQVPQFLELVADADAEDDSVV